MSEDNFESYNSGSTKPPVLDIGNINLPTIDQAFIGRHRNNPDGEQAVNDFAAAQWDAENGDLRRQVQMACNDIDERVKHSSKIISKAEKKLSGTEQFVRRADAQPAEGETSAADTSPTGTIPFSQWDPIHQWTAGTAVGFSVILQIMGMVSVSAILLASGTEPFISQPWMAAVMSFIVPAASLGIKFGYDLLPTDRAKSTYGLCVYSVAFVMLLIWVVTFALSFDGLSSEINIDDLGESSAKGHLLTAVQLLAEIFTGAALFMVASNIASPYAADAYIENPAWPHAKRAYNQAIKDHEVLMAEQKRLHGEREKLLASLEMYIASCTAEWISIRGTNA